MRPEAQEKCDGVLSGMRRGTADRRRRSGGAGPWNCPECDSHLRVANLDPLEFDSDDELDEDEVGQDADTGDDGDGDGDDEDDGGYGDDEEDWEE
jgi:hypothetical protein